MKRTRTLLMVGLGLLTAFALTACGGGGTGGTGTESTGGADTSFDKIKEKGEFVIGLDDTFVPMGFRDKDNNIIGFDVDLANEATALMGVKPKFQPINWELKEQELNSGTIDVIWNGYTVNEERLKKVDVTEAYMANKVVVVTMANSDIKTLADLKGKNVSSQAASGAAQLAADKGMVKDFKDGRLVEFDTYDFAFRDLENGNVDAIIADSIQADYYAKQKGLEKYAFVSEALGEDTFAVAVKKGSSQLQGELNKALNTLKENGKASEISDKWFGEDIILK